MDESLYDKDWAKEGILCRHWNPPAECEVRCECGHACYSHLTEPNPTECLADGCPCRKWKEKL